MFSILKFVLLSSSYLVRRKDASWSLNRPSGANLLARKQHMYFLVPM